MAQSPIPNSFNVAFDGLESSSPCNQCTFQATTSGSFTLTFKDIHQSSNRDLPKSSDFELDADGKGFISINAQKTVDDEDCRFKFSNEYTIRGNAIYITPVQGDEHDHGGINVYDIHAYPNEAYAKLVKGKESICYSTWLTSPGALLTCDSVFIDLAIGSGKVEKNDDQGHKECTLHSTTTITNGTGECLTTTTTLTHPATNRSSMPLYSLRNDVNCPELSGAIWVSKFPGSNNIQNLE